MHGDYQFANVMYHHGVPARLAAIIDWEMGTVGDPKLDLGWVVQSWPDDTSEASTGYVDLNGMPTRDELIEYYAAESGRQVDDIDYYVILARWKLAIVLEQGYKRSVDGSGDNEKLQAFGPVVLDLMRRGRRARRDEHLHLNRTHDETTRTIVGQEANDAHPRQDARRTGRPAHPARRRAGAGPRRAGGGRGRTMP